MKRLLFLVLFAPFAVLMSADDVPLIDDLFSTPQEGILEEEPEKLELEEEIVTTYPLRITGSVTAQGLFGTGFQSFEPVLITASAGGRLNAAISMDVKPLDYLRFFATTSASISESSFAPSWSISQFYVDYTLGSVFVRAGRQSLSWGGARLFPSPVNSILAGSASVPSVKVFVPFLTNGVTFMAYPYGTVDSGLGLSNTALIGKLDQLIGDVRLEIGASYRDQNRIDAVLGLRASIGDFELGFDGSMYIPYGANEISSDILGNLYWGPRNSGFHLLAEYTASDVGLGTWTQRLGVGSRITLGGGYGLALRWFHSLSDNSGQVILGLDGSLHQDLMLEIGIPLVYGEEGSYYRNTNPDPEDRLLALGIQLSVSASF